MTTLRESWLLLAAACACCSACALPMPRAWAVITLDANFDSASLCLVGQQCLRRHRRGELRSAAILVTLVGRDNFSNGEWKWIYFRASGVNGQLVNFEIGDDFDTGGCESRRPQDCLQLRSENTGRSSTTTS